MIERQQRLRRASEVRRVYADGRSWTHPLLVVVARPNGLATTRLGFTASRSVGSAVRRNRARRLLRESARHLLPSLRPGWDVMLVARARIATVRQPEVERALAGVLARAGLLEPPSSAVDGSR